MQSLARQIGRLADADERQLLEHDREDERERRVAERLVEEGWAGVCVERL